MFGRLAQQICQRRDANVSPTHSRPGGPGDPGCGLWSSQPLPSGSLNDAYVKYERPSIDSKPGGRLSYTSLTSTPRLMRSSRAASMSSTASISLSADPGSAAVRPLPKWIEHCE